MNTFVKIYEQTHKNTLQKRINSNKGEINEDILKENIESDKDPLYERALDIIKEEKRASTTLIQRKLGIGYSRAARIMDQLEETGIIKIGKNGEKELLI